MKEKNYYTVPYISNSALSWFKISPLYCHKRMAGGIKDEEKSYLTLGTQIHLALLEPGVFNSSYTVLDTPIPKAETQKNFCASYIDQVKAGIESEEASMTAYKDNYSVNNKSDKIIANSIQKLLTDLDGYISYLLAKEKYIEVLSESKFNLIQSVISTVKNHKKAKVLFDDETIKADNLLADAETQTFNELPIYWDYPLIVDNEPIKCKSLIDRLIINHKEKKVTLIDLKTTSKLGQFTEEFESREYYRQLSFYWMAINSYFTEIADYSKETFIVACSTVDPYECRVFDIGQEHLVKGAEEIIKAMNSIHWHIVTGQWDFPRAYHEGDGTEKL